MKALVLHDSPVAQAKIGAELMGKGFQVIALGSQAAAREWLAHDVVDVLVMDECVGSALTHTLALSAEKRNPYVSVVMLTERTGEAAEELYLLIPCLYSLLGRETPIPMIARLAMASIVNVAETEERVRSRKLWFAGTSAEDAGEDMRPARDIAQDLEQRIEETHQMPVRAAMQTAMTGAVPPPVPAQHAAPAPAPRAYEIAAQAGPLPNRMPSFLGRSFGQADTPLAAQPERQPGMIDPRLADWTSDTDYAVRPAVTTERRLNIG